MTEFEKQLAARLQAMDFVLTTLIASHFREMSAEDVDKTISGLERDFSTLTIPVDADPQADLDDVMKTHSDAQHFLGRILRQAARKGHA